MQDTPIHLNGPFKLKSDDWGHTIYGRDGVSIVTLTGQLIDGSRRIDKYPDGKIRTRQARLEEATFVLNAMNAAFVGSQQLLNNLGS